MRLSEATPPPFSGAKGVRRRQARRYILLLGAIAWAGACAVATLATVSKEEKGGGVCELAKTPSSGSWYDKQSISGGGGGYNAGEAYGDGKFDTGSIFDKLLNAKG